MPALGGVPVKQLARRDPEIEGLRMGDVRATFRRIDDTAFVAGEVDIVNAEDLRRVLAGDDDDILVDCAGLTFLDSSGIAVLAVEARRREAAGHRLRVANIQPNVRRVFEIAGMLEHLD